MPPNAAWSHTTYGLQLAHGSIPLSPSGSLTGPTRVSSLVKVSILSFIISWSGHLGSSSDHYLARAITCDGEGSPYTSEKRVPTTLVYSDSVSSKDWILDPVLLWLISELVRKIPHHIPSVRTGKRRLNSLRLSFVLNGHGSKLTVAVQIRRLIGSRMLRRHHRCLNCKPVVLYTRGNFIVQQSNWIYLLFPTLPLRQEVSASSQLNPSAWLPILQVNNAS